MKWSDNKETILKGVGTSGFCETLNYNNQGSYGRGKPGKVMEFKKCLFPDLEKILKKCNPKSFGKVMDICYIHMFINPEFEIISMFLKESRSKYKPAYTLILTFKKYINVYSFKQTIVSHSCLSFKVCCMLWNSHCLFKYYIFSLFHVYTEISQTVW